MKILTLSFLVMFLILAISVRAQNFDITANVQDEYLAGRTYTLNVIINNSGPDDWYSVSVLGTPPGWLSPESPSIRVSGGSSTTFKIFVQPSRDATPKTYNYVLTLTSTTTGEQVQKQLLINVQQVTSAVIKDFNVSCTSCQDSIVISGTVENVGTQPLDLDLLLTLGSEQRVVPIGTVSVLKQKQFEESIILGNFQPGNYVLDVKLRSEEGTLYTESKDVTVKPFGNILYDRQVTSSIFLSTITLTAFNDGNTETTANVESSVPPVWYSIFSGPEPNSAINGEYLWKVTLEPKESTKIVYSEIYWPSFAGIILLPIFGILLYWQMVALSIWKEIPGENIIRRGKDLSVALRVKNRRREMDNVVVTDFIPNRLSVTGHFETVKPLIRKISDGTELSWRIGNLKTHEERILHYKIKPAAEMIGSMHLPPASVKARYQGKPLIRHSNMVHLKTEKHESKIIAVKVSK